MIKILNTQQIKSLDEFTIQHEPILSIDLMERACRAFTSWFTERFTALNKIGIVCGTGNNGGDGLGVARMLSEWGYPVKVWIVRGGTAESADFKMNLERLSGKLEIAEITSSADQGLFTDRDILIDAIFGSGLSRPAEGIYAQAIRCMNQTDALKVAIDIPSGLMADKPSSDPIVRAHHTLTFQLPKLAFFLPENHQYTGEWTVVDIGLDKSFLKAAETSYYYLNQKTSRKILKPRSKFDHKGDFGHGLIVSGSYGKIGAAVLSSRAALRSGIGLLTVHIPRCGYGIIQAAVPEAMVDVDANETFFTNHLELDKYNVIGIGPGLGKDSETVDALRTILNDFRKPFVIDADALNIISEHPEMLKLIPAGSVLTPHPKEFERLVGKWKNDFERLDKQKKLAAELSSVVILKGAYTSLAAPDGTIYFNSTGNPGMATGGTGDVLTGVITALIAQNYSALDAARLGVFTHGLAGDIGAAEKGMISLTASDVVDHLPDAFKKISR
jgi:NAD(P)H-hydrate epimerase